MCRVIDYCIILFYFSKNLLAHGPVPNQSINRTAICTFHPRYFTPEASRYFTPGVPYTREVSLEIVTRQLFLSPCCFHCENEMLVPGFKGQYSDGLKTLKQL
jgi:hypothetical protein